MSLNESHLEEATLDWFRELGYQTIHGPNIAPGEPGAERQTLGQTVLEGRLREALRRLNPDMPEESREEALRKITRISTPSLIQTNRAFHRLIRDGVPVEWRFVRSDCHPKQPRNYHSFAPVCGSGRTKSSSHRSSL